MKAPVVEGDPICVSSGSGVCRFVASHELDTSPRGGNDVLFCLQMERGRHRQAWKRMLKATHERGQRV